MHHSTLKADDLIASVFEAHKPAGLGADKENEPATAASARHPLSSKRVIRTFLMEVSCWDNCRVLRAVN